MSHNTVNPQLVTLYHEDGSETGTVGNPLYVQSDDTTPVTVTDAQASNAVTTRFGSIGITATTIADANSDRRGMIIFNEGTSQDAYVKYGSGATVTDYAFRVIKAGGYWEMPNPIYTGIVSAVVGSGTTILQVTETEV